MSAWHRRVLHREGPTASASDRTIEQSAMSAAGIGLSRAPADHRTRRRTRNGLALVRRDLGHERYVAQLGASGRGIGRWEAACLDLVTGEQFVVSSTDPDVEAPRLAVTDLPPALLAAWPRDGRGRPIRLGDNDGPNGRTVGPEQLRGLAGSADSAPAQGSLFG